jgi:hypothetical protein
MCLLRLFNYKGQKELHEPRGLCEILFVIPFHFAAQKRRELAFGVFESAVESEMTRPSGAYFAGTKGTRIFWTSSRMALYSASGN